MYENGIYLQCIKSNEGRYSMHCEKVLPYEIEACITYPYNSYADYIKDSGCYYLAPAICKDIIINAGACGLPVPEAIVKVRQYINKKKGLLEDIIPVLQNINRDIICYYASELAEGLVKASDNSKGVEIIFGYPKVLVINVN